VGSLTPLSHGGALLRLTVLGSAPVMAAEISPTDLWLVVASISIGGGQPAESGSWIPHLAPAMSWDGALANENHAPTPFMAGNGGMYAC
jgi:hypothetical protein